MKKRGSRHPAQLAAKRNWPFGTYANVGKPSASVRGNTPGYNMIALAPRDVDGFADVTGLPVVLVSGEWYNQSASNDVAQSGLNSADNNRAYAAQRAAAGKVSKHLMWTTTSDDHEGPNRDAFNTSLMNNHPNIDVVIPVHTDPTIGVNGQYSNRTYFNDNAHLTAAGYTVLANLIDAALTSAGYSG